MVRKNQLIFHGEANATSSYLYLFIISPLLCGVELIVL